MTAEQLCFCARLFLVAAKGQGYSRCALLCGKQESCTVHFCNFHDDWWGEDTQEQGTCTGLSSQTPVAPHSSGSHVASGFYAKPPPFGFGLFWKENVFLLHYEATASSSVVVLMLMSSGRVITCFLNPKLVTKLSDLSTSRKKMKHFQVLPEMTPTELSREGGPICHPVKPCCIILSEQRLDSCKIKDLVDW